jgi:RNA polymerase sigma factor (sigma-70 family)
LIQEKDHTLLSISPMLPPVDKDQMNWENADDSQLIAACVQGEEQAWATLINRYSRLIYTIPLRFGFSKMIADEIFQETCLILLEKLDSLQQTERVRSWLVTVCKRVCIQHMRQNKDVQTIEGLELDGRFPDLDSELILLEKQHLVQEAMQRLPDRCQQLIQALFFDDPPAPYDDIAAILNISKGSIGPTRSRCLEKLHQELENLGQI